MITLFWISLTAVVYCYFGYPFIIFLLARIKPAAIRKSDVEPSISVIISLYNEEDVILEKINNLLKLDYPQEKIEILLGSDGSTDRTHEIVNSFKDPRIKLFISSERRGKMAVLNDLIPQAKHEIIVFTDARQIFETNAIRKLVSNFADTKVGCVSGELLFAPKEGGTAQGVNLYWKYEKFIRSQESAVHSMLGATGAIYAIRRKLFIPGPSNVVLDDMYTPLKIIQQGYRAIFDDTAFAYDQVASKPKEEYRRKTRTLYGNYQIFSLFPEMFNPLVSPIAFQFFSHKLLRVLVPFFLITIVFINFCLQNKDIFSLLWMLQVIFYCMALLGHLTHGYKNKLFKLINKICYIPYVFCLLNYSALVGFWRFITAKQQSTWQKARDL